MSAGRRSPPGARSRPGSSNATGNRRADSRGAGSQRRCAGRSAGGRHHGREEDLRYDPDVPSIDADQSEDRFAIEPEGIGIEATVETRGQTGVEMEALTAVSGAALTIYDMVKAVDRGMTIERISSRRRKAAKAGIGCAMSKTERGARFLDRPPRSILFRRLE